MVARTSFSSTQDRLRSTQGLKEEEREEREFVFDDEENGLGEDGFVQLSRQPLRHTIQSISTQILSTPTLYQPEKPSTSHTRRNTLNALEYWT